MTRPKTFPELYNRRREVRKSAVDTPAPVPAVVVPVLTQFGTALETSATAEYPAAELERAILAAAESIIKAAVAAVTAEITPRWRCRRERSSRSVARAGPPSSAARRRWPARARAR